MPYFVTWDPKIMIPYRMSFDEGKTWESLTNLTNLKIKYFGDWYRNQYKK
jgi:hypothetical protein